MAQEDEELLLKDLCERLPYRPKIKIGKYYDYTLMGIDLSKEKPIIVELEGHSFGVSCKNVQLVLRPMSSMTEEEKRELEIIIDGILGYNAKNYFHSENDYNWNTLYNTHDWLNSHQFDYRGLIPKGLASEALPSMY